MLARWVALVGDVRTFNGSELAAEPSVSATEKFRYWRAKLTDGTAVRAIVWGTPDGRISLSVQQRAFPDRASADACKAWWKEFVAPLRVGVERAKGGQER